MPKSKPKKFINTDKYYGISTNIILYRKLAGMTQSQLAERIGVSQPYLSKVESLNNPTMCSLEILFDIADVLHIPVYKLFMDEPET